MGSEKYCPLASIRAALDQSVLENNVHGGSRIAARVSLLLCCEPALKTLENKI